MTRQLRSLALAATCASMLLLQAPPAAVAQDESAPQPMIGEPAPGFSLEGVDGATLDLADLRGTFVVIHFGTSW